MKTIISSLILLFASNAFAEKWVLTTLEWPPFTCEACPDQGAGSKALKEAMKTVGVEVEFKFLPWERAVKEGLNKEYVGVYPTWPEDVTAPFVGSPAVFKSPLGFIENAKKPLNITKLDDLKGKSVGVVSGYGNTVDFNKMTASGAIKADAAPSDDVNVKKVAAGRLDAAIIDVNNAKYFLLKDLKSEAGNIKISTFVAENKNLEIAFNTHDTASRSAKIKEALAKVDTQKIVDEWLQKHMK